MFGKQEIDSHADEREQEERKVLRRISKLIQKAESTSHEPEQEAFEKKARELMKKHSISRGEIGRSDFVRRVIRSRYKATPGWQKQIIFKTARFLGCYALHTRTGSGTYQKWKIFGHKRDVKLARYMVGAIEGQIKALVGQWKEDRKQEQEQIEAEIKELEEEVAEIRELLDEEDLSAKEESRWCSEVCAKEEKIRALEGKLKLKSTGRSATNGYRTGLAKGVTSRLWEMAETVSGGDAEKALVPTEERDQKYEKAQEMYDGKVASSFGGPNSSDMMATREGYQDSEQIDIHKSAPEPSKEETAALPEG
jgi:hypothetical protein